MRFYYAMFYEPTNDEFSASIQDEYETVLYEIETTEEMLSLLQSNKMDHIDDLIGLKKMLVHEAILRDEDTLELGGVWL